MLRRIRSHAQGLRFHDALLNSPLTIVYQCIGNVKAATLENSLRADVSNSHDVISAVPVSFRVKNSLASATGRPDITAFLQSANVLVGWDLKPKDAPAAHAGPRTVMESERLSELVSKASASAAASQQGPRRQPPQRLLSVIIKASLRLAEKYPVAPLAGFFHGQRIALADLQRWSELDDATVYGELLGQLGSVPHTLVERISFGDGGVSALLEAQNGALLSCLEARKADSPERVDGSKATT